jgi:hypothetical protein
MKMGLAVQTDGWDDNPNGRKEGEDGILELASKSGSTEDHKTSKPVDKGYTNVQKATLERTCRFGEHSIQYI